MRLKIELIALAVFLFAISTLFFSWKHERSERIRTEGNQTALLTDIVHYKTKDSLNAARVKTLTLTAKELKTYESELVEKLKEKDIKIKRLQSHTEVKTVTKIEFKTVMKDSVVYVPGQDSLIEMKCLEYIRPFVNFSACKVSELDTFQVKINIPVNLEHNAFRVPKMFLGIIPHGVASIDLDVECKNPYTDITYIKNIELKKRRRK